MKSKRDHRVPLSARAQGVLQEARELADSSSLVFPSPRGGAISANTLSKLLRQLDIDAVPHGFRSSFRDWAAECSDAPREICEFALAHVNSDRVEAAYRRTDLLEQRRVLMEQWSAFWAISRRRRGSNSAIGTTSGDIREHHLQGMPSALRRRAVIRRAALTPQNQTTSMGSRADRR